MTQPLNGKSIKEFGAMFLDCHVFFQSLMCTHKLSFSLDILHI